jgi:hypothetical protein
LAVDQASGAVSQIGSVVPTDGQPLSVVCDPTGQFVYVESVGAGPTTNTDLLHLAAYAISTSPATAGQLLPQSEYSSQLLVGTSYPMVLIE